MTNRRNFITGAAGAMVGASLVSKAGAAAIPEAPQQSSAATQPPLHPASGRPYNPVVTLNGWSLPWRMKDGVKEFHLVAEPVVREIAPGMKANLWGYNGMLIDVFQLLADAREQVAGVVASVEATRDFWVADARLQAALAGRSPPGHPQAATPASFTE